MESISSSERSDRSESEYEVERIIGRRKDSDGDIEYKIKWRGYGSEEDSWAKEKELSNATALIAEFEKLAKKKLQEKKRQQKKIKKKKRQKKSRGPKRKNVSNSKVSARYIVQDMYKVPGEENETLFKVIDSNTMTPHFLSKDYLFEKDPLALAIYYDQIVVFS